MYKSGQINNYKIPEDAETYIYNDVEYKTILTDKNIVKLGYCCEEKGVIYPLYLKVKGTYYPFKIPEKCIYEASVLNEVEEGNIFITGVQVPINLKFTLDYVEQY